MTRKYVYLDPYYDSSDKTGFFVVPRPQMVGHLHGWTF